MNTVGAICGILLGIVFVWSGAAKIRQGDAWQVVDTPFSTSVRLVDRSVEFVLPWLEIVLGACLIAQVSPLWMGIVAAVLLSIFSVALMKVIARGESTPCRCFGEVSAAPVSWRHVARNAAFIALAAATVVGA